MSPKTWTPESLGHAPAPPSLCHKASQGALTLVGREGEAGGKEVAWARAGTRWEEVKWGLMVVAVVRAGRKEGREAGGERRKGHGGGATPPAPHCLAPVTAVKEGEAAGRKERERGGGEGRQGEAPLPHS